MKRFLLWSLLLALVGILTYACDDSDEVVMLPSDPALTISCNPAIVLPSANQTEGVIDYTVVNPFGEMIATAKSNVGWVMPKISTKGKMGTNRGRQGRCSSTKYRAGRGQYTR